jgi:negative regulator of flagellin synthesis FlgM
VKIENSIKAIPGGSINENSTPSQKSGQRAGEIATSRNAGSESDTVRLSREAQSIDKNLANDEVFDTARVAEIKRAISEGRFVVNPDKVADRLLETVRELIQSKRG